MKIIHLHFRRPPAIVSIKRKSPEESLARLTINSLIGSHVDEETLVSSQLQQTWSRLLFATVGLLYLLLQDSRYTPIEMLFLVSAIFYFSYNLLALHAVHVKAVSFPRLLFAPLLDVYVVSVGMLLDSGQTSGLYLIYYIVIFGNALRFGVPMFFYTQALAFLGLLSVCLTTVLQLELALDWNLLFLQGFALIVIPAYVQQIKSKADRAFVEKIQAENATFGLLDIGPLPAFTFHLDDEGVPRVLHANSAMGDIYADAVANLDNGPVSAIALSEDGDEIVRACQDVFGGTDEVDPIQFYIRGRNSKEQVLQLSGQSMRLPWKDGWIGVCFLSDISQREAERSELEQSLYQSQLDTLVAGVVHDFRNILTSIIGTVEILGFSAKDEETKKNLQLILDAGDRGSDMTTNLLNLTRMKHEKPAKAFSEKSIRLSLNSIIGLMRIHMPPHIQLHLEIDSDLPPVSISNTEIEQIVTNLISNASQAIGESGTIRVKLYHDLSKSSTGPGLLRIRVDDDGEGIPLEDIQNITKPFWTSRKEQGGTGLGLAMVQRIVRHYGGGLDIESEVGKGTSISISVPACEENEKDAKNSQQQNSAVESKPSSPAQLDIPPATILVVDDNPEVLAVHSAHLEQMGHSVLTASNGSDGIALFRNQSERIELVITDFKMPGMNGLEFSVAIRKINPEMPIMMITAFGDIENLERAAELGIFTLHKPVHFNQLQKSVQDMLSQLQV